MKKNIYILFLFLTTLICSIELPHPKNDQLFSEYTSYRYAKYLKKPIVGNGYLAMNGKDKFVFIQIKPVFVKIKKSGNVTSYQKGNSMPVDISSMAIDFFFLFEDESSFEKKYNINKIPKDDYVEYTVIPKEQSNLKILKIISKIDIIEKMELFFQDDTKLIYDFKNAVTGKAPDEKYF